MKRRFGGCICVLLTAVLCAVLLLRCLIVNRYACEPEEETKRENLKQILTFYR